MGLLFTSCFNLFLQYSRTNIAGIAYGEQRHEPHRDTYSDGKNKG